MEGDNSHIDAVDVKQEAIFIFGISVLGVRQQLIDISLLPGCR
jgi:hypothetical protein